MRYRQSDWRQVDSRKTDWKLIRMADSPVGSGPGQREPHLILRRQDHRVSGFTGCNQMAGAYTLDGQALVFSQMISTKMACLGGGMETEAAFTAALQQVRAWSIAGDRLTLSDAAGQPVLELQSLGPAPNTL
jgi:heat shock protein HslJ